MRRLWTEPTVDHDGPRFHYSGVGIGVLPVQRPPDVWLGGRAPGELRRVGRLADGWLPSFTTPEEAAAGREVVVEAADGRGTRDRPRALGRAGRVRARRDPRADRRARRQAAPGRRPGGGRARSATTRCARSSRASSPSGFSKLVPVPFGTAIDDWERELAVARRRDPRPPELLPNAHSVESDPNGSTPAQPSRCW